MKVFFFIQKRKIKYSIATVCFYFEEERKKELFIAVNSNFKWNYTNIEYEDGDLI